MPDSSHNTVLIVGVGAGLSASLARLFSKFGLKIALASRSIDDIAGLASETGARVFACDASQESQVAQLFRDIDATLGSPDVVIYNASFRTRGEFIDFVPADVQKAIAISAFGAFLVAQQAARRMLPNKHGAIFFTGASAGVKGYPRSAPFAMAKSPCAACRKALRANCNRKASTSPIS